MVNNPSAPISVKKSDSVLTQANRLELQSRQRKMNYTIDTQLEIANSRFHSITETIAQGVIIFDKSGVIEFFSESASRIFGYSSSEMTGLSVALLLPGGMQQGEVTLGQKKDGSTVSLSVEISRNDVGRLSEYLCIVSETDSGRQVMRQMEQLQNQIAEAHQKRSDWIHHLKDAVSPVLQEDMSTVEWLLPKCKGETAAESLSNIRKNSQSLIALLEQLTEVVDRELSAEKVERVAVPLARIVDEFRDPKHPLLARKNLNFESAGLGRLPETVFTHRKTVCRILWQLIHNATQFTNVGSIKLTWEMVAEEEGKYPRRLRFQVSDTGSGIPLAMQGLIFEPFVRRRGFQSEIQQHFGLGLPLVQELARSINGQIEYQAVKPSGSVFSLTIDVGECLDWTSAADESDASQEEHLQTVKRKQYQAWKSPV